MKEVLKYVAAFAALAALAAPAASGATEVNWSAVRPVGLTLFYPGAASWEFVTGEDHRLGSREIKRERKDCRYCHLSKAGELDLKADEIASGKLHMKKSRDLFEPNPTPGKLGTLDAMVQAAYDKDFIYIRVEWPSKGASWRAKNAPGVIRDRVSLQLNNASAAFRKYGCFISCHDDLTAMPKAHSKKEITSDPYYSKLGRDDVRLYAFYARDSWSKRKSEKELERLLSAGYSIDLWSAEFIEASVHALDGWILEDRLWEDNASIEASGGWSDNRYAAVFKRALKAKDGQDIDIKEGDVFSFGLAVHDDATAKRRHYVSFPFTVGIGADADIKAVRLGK
ncbi:MAG: ethylbenzene dehydrogenase-related protein [Deltaproteobacteria bacterium]